MLYQIEILHNYISVSFSESVNLENILAAVRETMSLDRYDQLNDLWDFTDVRLNLNYSQFNPINDTIIELYPENPKRNKTALVAESGLLIAMGELWAKSAEILPFEIEIFNDCKAAEKWLTS